MCAVQIVERDRVRQRKERKRTERVREREQRRVQHNNVIFTLHSTLLLPTLFLLAGLDARFFMVTSKSRRALLDEQNQVNSDEAKIEKTSHVSFYPVERERGREGEGKGEKLKRK